MKHEESKNHRWNLKQLEQQDGGSVPLITKEGTTNNSDVFDPSNDNPASQTTHS
jgi:hypothetical protein